MLPTRRQDLILHKYSVSKLATQPKCLDMLPEMKKGKKVSRAIVCGKKV